MAGKLQPEYSGNPGNNKYKGIMAKQLASFISAKKYFTLFSALKQKRFSHITLYTSFFGLQYIFLKQPHDRKSVNRKMKDAHQRLPLFWVPTMFLALSPAVFNWPITSTEGREYI